MAFTVDNAFLETFDPIFLEMIKKPQGSQLMNIVTPRTIIGDTQYLRQFDVGKAKWRSDAAQKTDYAPVKYDRRKVRPKPLDIPIMFDEIDMIRMGTPPIQEIAMSAAAECGVLIDQEIIDGMMRDVETENGKAKLTDENKITWDSAPYGTDTTPEIAHSLNTYKCATAVARMDRRFCTGSKGCIASSKALTSLRIDPRMANKDFNLQPAMATKMNTPFAGIDFFITFENMPKWDRAVPQPPAPQPPISVGSKEYAIVFDTSTIILASNMPLRMKNGQDANKYLNDVIIYTGMYDCVRMYEVGVQLIEVIIPAAA